MFQETHAHHDCHFDPPPGFLAYSQGRVYSTDRLENAWGGVVTFVRNTIVARRVEDLCSPDILALCIGDTVYFNTYVIPETTRVPWNSWTDVHPWDALVESILMTISLGLEFFVAGDLNARTGAQSPSIEHPRRTSADSFVSMRGHALLSFCAENGLFILNGSDGVGGDHSGPTSFQIRRDTNDQRVFVNSVIDYIIASREAMTRVLRLDVGDRTDWSDHACLLLDVASPLSVKHSHVPQTPRNRTRAHIDWEPSTEFEFMVRDTLEKGKGDNASHVLSLYGRASEPVPASCRKGFTDGSCLNNNRPNARAGAGIYFGPGAPASNELSFRVTGAQTNNRGELLGGLVALQSTPLYRPLQILTDSTYYLICSLVYWAWDNSQLGWKCANGDLLQALVGWIQARSAPLILTHVRAHSGNVHNDRADALAKAGASLPLPAPGSAGDALSLPAPPPFSAEGSTTAKVSTDLPENDELPSRPHARIASSAVHRGRTHLRTRRTNFLTELKDAAKSGSAAFWRFYKRARYPLAPESRVNLEQLFGVFVPRMNPPDPVKSGFDPEALKQESARASQIPFPSPPSCHPHFNEEVCSEDIAEVKSYLKTHQHSDSKGVDESTYSQLMGVENEKLRDIFREAFGKRKFSRAWLIAMIIAILKTGKDSSDPNNYRAIALECCILKFASLLILLKLTKALNAAKIIPPSQNGFRAHYRTNNNAFVLRHLIEKSGSINGTLYVAFVDISNAFPSMNQDSLWNKLAHYGLTGQYFDWLRDLYSNMTYMLTHDGTLSDEYRALCGVLMGDPSSPTLWNVFLSTLNLPLHPDDIALDEVVISHLEHADDIVLISRTAEGLQHHLNTLHGWCRANFLVLSAGKSYVMVFGPLPLALPVFTIADIPLEIRDRVRYLGVFFQSTHREIFAQHYREKSQSAITAARGIMGCDLLVGRYNLPPEVARTLYTALVDCHLISGFEIAIDNHESLITLLESFQRRFLRRMLGLSPRSMVAPLFTETGIMPIRTRHVIIALGYLDYLLGLDNGYYVYHALRESDRLRMAGKECWLGDLDKAIRNLPGDVSLPALRDLPRSRIPALIKRIRKATLDELQAQIDNSSRLALLHGRLEPQEDGPAQRNPMCLRHYLSRVTTPSHRLSLTRLICGDMTPAIFRCSIGKTGVDERDWLQKRCRACANHLETPQHVLLQCEGDDRISALRAAFLCDIASATPLPALHRFSDSSALHYLRLWIFHWMNVIPVSRFINDVVVRWKELARMLHVTRLVDGDDSGDPRELALLAVDGELDDLEVDEELVEDLLNLI